MSTFSSMNWRTERLEMVTLAASIMIAATSCGARALPSDGAPSVADPQSMNVPAAAAPPPAPRGVPTGDPEPAPSPSTAPPSPPVMPGPQLSDPQIVEALQLIVEGDIHVALGQVTLGYGMDPRVHSFAAGVVAVQRPEDQPIQLLTARIGRADSDVKADLQSDIEAVVADLSANRETPCLVDQRYMDFQVRFDAKAFAIITGTLLPSAADGQLRDELSREATLLDAETDEANAVHDAIEPQEDDCEAIAAAAAH